MSCPNCQAEVADPEAPFRPFCSQRCKLLDLSRWLDGTYRVEGQSASASEMGEELERARRRDERN